MKRTLGIVAVVGIISGCVPAPKPTISLGTGIGVAQGTTSAYGMKPRNYTGAIQSYFNAKFKQGAQYKFSEPKKAYKRKGFAYGGELAWKGWLVETAVSTQNRTGRWLTPKPYMVLFSGEQIVEDILGSSHKLLTKVN